MSLVVAIPFGVASAIAYAASTAVQHSAAHTGTGQADARGLVHLLRDRRWLMSIGGDTLGFVLQVAALSSGAVVLVQPLLVLTLPVSLAFGALLGGPRPRRGDYLACVVILGALTVFFLLLGTPGAGRPPSSRGVGGTVLGVFVGGLLLCLAVRRRRPAVRAGVYGGVAGVWFGTLGVLVEADATVFGDHGLNGLLTSAAGLIPLVGLAVIGAAGMTLTQISFQVGALAASFPANQAADPFAAVLLGALLLHEHVPVGNGRVLTYLLCLVAITVAAVWLASPPPGAAEPPQQSGTMEGMSTERRLRSEK